MVQSQPCGHRFPAFSVFFPLIPPVWISAWTFAAAYLEYRRRPSGMTSLPRSAWRDLLLCTEEMFFIPELPSIPDFSNPYMHDQMTQWNVPSKRYRVSGSLTSLKFAYISNIDIGCYCRCRTVWPALGSPIIEAWNPRAHSRGFRSSGPTATSSTLWPTGNPRVAAGWHLGGGAATRPHAEHHVLAPIWRP